MGHVTLAEIKGGDIRERQREMAQTRDRKHGKCCVFPGECQCLFVYNDNNN